MIVKQLQFKYKYKDLRFTPYLVVALKEEEEEEVVVAVEEVVVVVEEEEEEGKNQWVFLRYLQV